METAEFFEADRTYQRRRWIFQCLAVAPNPFNQETRAVGFLYRHGEPATATALDPDDWEHGEWTPAEDNEHRARQAELAREAATREKVAGEIEQRYFSIITGEAPETERALDLAAEIARTGNPFIR